jgi:hypothetical protein
MNDPKSQKIVDDIMKGLAEQDAQGVEPTSADPIEETPAVAPEETPPSIDPLVEDTGTLEPAEPLEGAVVETEETTLTPTEDGVDSFYNDWDQATTTVDEPTYDFTSLSSKLGFEAASEEDFVTKFNEIQSHTADLETKVKDSNLDGIPTDLRDAIELAKDGGDYREFLQVATVDISKVDPTALAEEQIASYFYDSDGAFDQEGYTEQLERLTDRELEFKGKEIQRQMLAEQARAREALNARATQKRQLRELEARRAVDDLKDVGGFQLKPQHKADILSTLSSNAYEDKLFNGADGKRDYSKVARLLFLDENFDAINQMFKTRIRNGMKREVIDEIGNQTVTKPANREELTPQPVDPLDLFKKQAEAQASYMNRTPSEMAALWAGQHKK